MRELTERSSRPWGRWLLLLAYVAVLVCLWLAWRDPAMRHWLDPQLLSRLGRDLLATPLGPVAVIGGYVVAVALGMPVLVLVTVGALVFEPWPGMLYALLGMVAGSVVTYGLGRFTGASTMDALVKGKLALLARQLQKRGLLTMIAVRVLPLAPFVMVNMLAGSLRVRLRDYVLGTFLGLLPGTVLISLFTDQLSHAWQNPNTKAYVGVGLCLVATVAVSLWVRRRFSRAG